MSETDNKELFQERVRYLVRIVGSIDRLAKLAGLSPRIIAKYLAGQADPSRERLVALAEAAQVNVLWLATGLGPISESPNGAIIESYAIRSASYITAIGARHSEFVFIPMVQGRISAGGGLIPDNMIDMAVAFRKDWIQRKGGPKNMSVIRVQGDSMEPTLKAGDIVLVNHNKTAVEAKGGIYAIVYRDEIMIKRVSVNVTSQQLRITGDNKNYPAFSADPDSIVINGKVIWCGRDLEQ